MSKDDTIEPENQISSPKLGDERQRLFLTILMPELNKFPLSLQTRLIIAAHAAYESGWGTAYPSKGFNYWNLTRTEKDTRPIIMGWDLEFDKNNVAKKITQRFRKYESPGEAVKDYLDFLSMPRYADAKHELLLGNAEAFIRALAVQPDPKKGGFYTLPVDRFRLRDGKMHKGYLVEFTEKLEEVTKILDKY